MDAAMPTTLHLDGRCTGLRAHRAMGLHGHAGRDVGGGTGGDFGVGDAGARGQCADREFGGGGVDDGACELDLHLG